MMRHSFLPKLFIESIKASRIQTLSLISKNQVSHTLSFVKDHCREVQRCEFSPTSRMYLFLNLRTLWTRVACSPVMSECIFLMRRGEKRRGGRQQDEEEEEKEEEEEEEEEETSRRKNKDNKKRKSKESRDEVADSDFDMQEVQTKFEKTIQWAIKKLATIRVGRADPSLLDHIRYNDKPLQNFAVITVRDPMTLSVSPFDPNLLSDLQKTIQMGKSNTNTESQDQSSSSSGVSFFRFNTHIEGRTILVSIPKPTREFRDSLIKLAKESVEEAKTSVRNTRKKALSDLKKLKLPEDDEKFKEKEIQKYHDEAIKKLDQLFTQKQKEINS